MKKANNKNNICSQADQFPDSVAHVHKCENQQRTWQEEHVEKGRN